MPKERAFPKKKLPPVPKLPIHLLAVDPDDPSAVAGVAWARLSKDLKVAAEQLTVKQVRFLVDTYYQVQQFRIEAAGQARAAETAGEPLDFVAWVANIMYVMEKATQDALDRYTETRPEGRWAKSVCGIGPVLSAGLLAHIDITRARTAGAIWRFAGYDNTNEWVGKEGAEKIIAEHWDSKESGEQNLIRIAGTMKRRPESLITVAKKKTGKVTKLSATSALARRPWNAQLKLLCWKIGESFVKVQANENDVYGKIYVERKALERERNEGGAFADQAAAALAAKKYRKETFARAAYEAGRLPDAHIHARARRYAVKLFLAHFHHVSYEVHYGTPPPKPYIIEHGGHTHYLAPPNWPMSE